jgi:hypothetical protein
MTIILRMDAFASTFPVKNGYLLTKLYEDICPLEYKLYGDLPTFNFE